MVGGVALLGRILPFKPAYLPSDALKILGDSVHMGAPLGVVVCPKTNLHILEYAENLPIRRARRPCDGGECTNTGSLKSILCRLALNENHPRSRCPLGCKLGAREW